jgi:hypothetical protein
MKKVKRNYMKFMKIQKEIKIKSIHYFAQMVLASLSY